MMKSVLILGTLALTVFCDLTISNDDSVRFLATDSACIVYTNYTVYTLTHLMQDEDQAYTYSPRTFKWNFCKNIQKQCNGVDSMFAWFEDTKKVDTCFTLTPPISDVNPSYTTSDTQLEMAITSTETCQGDTKYGSYIVVQCNPDVDYEFVSISEPYSCTPTLTVVSKDGCGVAKFNAIWVWVQENKIVIMISCIIIGFVLNFFGRKLFRPVIFLSGLFLTLVAIMIVFYLLFFDSNRKSYVGWIVLAVGFVAGIVIGFLLVKFIKVGAFIFAAWGGFTLGLILWNTFIYLSGQVWVMWVVSIALGLIFGVLAFKLFEHVLIFSTTFIGTYLFIRSIGEVAGNYPNEFQISELIKEGVYSSIPAIFYAYFAGMMVMIILGLVLQYRMKRNEYTDMNPYKRLS